MLRIAVSELRSGVNNIELFFTGSEGSQVSLEVPGKTRNTGKYHVQKCLRIEACPSPTYFQLFISFCIMHCFSPFPV